MARCRGLSLPPVLCGAFYWRDGLVLADKQAQDGFPVVYTRAPEGTNLVEAQDDEQAAQKTVLGRVRDPIRAQQYSIRAVQSYIGWIGRFIPFHDTRRPKEMSADEIEEYLTHLLMA